MNLRFLKSLVAFSEAESLTAAARALGLSHSAVSLQVKSLEEELQVRLVDRSTRPPRLTDDGLRLVELARKMLELDAEIRAIGAGDTLVGSVSIGVVPSALVRLMPPALARLREAHPGLDLQIKSGLSQELMMDVMRRNLHVALVTQPETLPPGVVEKLVCREPLDVIAPPDTKIRDVEELLTRYPFIWFNRRTWTGQQIEMHLTRRKLKIKTSMEIDSIEALEALVLNGFGVSISPRRVGFAEHESRLQRIPFGPTEVFRGLSLVSLERAPRQRVIDALERELRAILKTSDPTPKGLS